MINEVILYGADKYATIFVFYFLKHTFRHLKETV